MRIGIYFILFICFCIVIAPLFITIALVIWITTGFPILFIQLRTGKHGKPFRMYKFRTMIIGAEIQQKMLRGKNEAHGPVFKIHNDPRFTPIGKFLSHTGLDELPQLINILKGEMAFLGPRPLPLEETKKLTKKQRERYNVKPGIISPWVLQGYHSHTFEAWMESDRLYATKKSLKTDIQLIVATIPLFIILLQKELKRIFS